MPQNIIIIGAGPAGEAAATLLAQKSKTGTPLNITLIDRENVGGLCLNKGCIPSKTLLEAVHQKKQAGQPLNWAEIQAKKNDVVNGIRSQMEARLRREKVNIIHGTAKFNSKNSVIVHIDGKDEVIEFDKAILAAGTEIFYPEPLIEFKDDLLNSDRMLLLTDIPESVVVVGGGAIGCEFACLLQAAGSEVTIIEMTNALLPGEDEAIVTALINSYEQRGIQVKTGAVVKSLRKTDTGWNIELSTGEILEPDALLSCVGRTTTLQSFELEKAGIEVQNRKLVLTPQLQTTNPNVFAAGDIAGSRLAHHAATQGETVALNILGESKVCDDRFVPRCLYSWPEVASVGTWKYALEQKGLPVKTSRAFFKGSSKALAAGETEGFVQIVFDPETKKILGAQIIGPHATELIHIFSVALKAEMTTKNLAEIMFAHPTLAEVIKDAAKK